MFNALKYSRKLVQAGQTQEVADIFAEAMVDMAESNFTTKSDLRDLRSELSEFKLDVRNEFVNVRQEIKFVESNLSKDIKTAHWASLYPSEVFDLNKISVMIAS